MAEAAAVKEPEKSLWERVGRVGNLLNQGVESMVYGTLSLPALVADGYLNIYRTGREALGGEAFQESNLYARSKQSLTDWGRKMDGSYGKVVGPQNATEAKIVLGTELVTALATPGAIKSLKTLAEGTAVVKSAGTTAAATTATAEATTTAANAAQASTTAKAATAAEGTIEWVAPTLSPEAKAFAAQKAAARAEAANTAAATATKTTAAAAKAEYGTNEILKILKREKDLPARLEALSGHGAKADAMVERLIAGARKSGVSGDDWAAIKNSRSLPQATIERVGKIRDDYLSSAWGIGPAWERAKGTAAYMRAYPWETAARAVVTPLSIPFGIASWGLRNHTGKALLLGGGAATYFGVNALADSAEPTPVKLQATAGPSPAPTRDVPVAESLAKSATDTAIAISKMTTTSALAVALAAASKLPGLGTTALNAARGSAQSLVQEIADGEPDIAKAWDKSQEKLNKILPGVHLKTLGDFVKGKGVEDMTAEERTRVSDALAAITQPNGDKARAFRSMVVAEAKQKAEQAAQIAGIGGSASGGSQEGGEGTDNDDPGLGNMINGLAGQMLGLDPKNVNAASVAAALRQKAKDNPHIALGMAIGAMSGMKNSNSKMEMAWKVPLYSAMWGIAFMMLGPILQPLMGLLGQKMDGLKDQFHKSQVAPYANGALPSTAEPKTAAPAADKPAMPSGEAKTMALFQQNGASMTEETPTVVVPAARKPVARLDAVMA